MIVFLGLRKSIFFSPHNNVLSCMHFRSRIVNSFMRYIMKMDECLSPRKYVRKGENYLCIANLKSLISFVLCHAPNKNKKNSSFKSNENIHKKEDGSST